MIKSIINVSESIAEDELRSEGGGGSLYCGENPVGTGLSGLDGGDISIFGHGEM